MKKGIDLERMPIQLSQEAARRLLLAAQGLQQPPQQPATKADVLALIRQMGLLQIDTISVVARSPYLVLWSRLRTYEPRWLEELLAEGALFEYWAHAACFLPIEDFPIYRRRMHDFAANNRWRVEEEAVQRVRERLQQQGAVRSADFERPDLKRGTWWDWKPEKVALEHLFNAGELMIARREGFQRLYDLRERVLPDWDEAHTLPHDAGCRALILKAVQALGVCKARWLLLYFPDYLRVHTNKKTLATLLESLVEEGSLLSATVEGWNEPAYIHSANLAWAQQAAAGQLQPTFTTLLSPFDPVVSDRARAEELFGFSYRIETYTPAEKRRYGYFSLPILHRGQLVGRLDAKAHRKDGLFEVKTLHLEPHVLPTEELLADLHETLHACAQWHQTPQVVVRQSDPAGVAHHLAGRH